VDWFYLFARGGGGGGGARGKKREEKRQKNPKNSVSRFLFAPVVVHDRVHALDPVGVQVPVQHQPLRPALLRRGGHLAHGAAQHAVAPLARGHVDVAVELLGADRLWVNLAHGHALAVVGTQVVVGHRRVARTQGHALLQRAREHGARLGAAAARGAHQEDAVADGQQLRQLDDAQHKVRVGHQSELGGGLGDAALEARVAAALGRVAREQVGQQGEEDGQVAREDFRNVEVAQRAEQHVGLDARLQVLRRLAAPRGRRPLGAQQGAGHHQHALDRAQAPVVVLLRVEHVLEHKVQGRELLRQGARRHKPLGHEHVLHDELAVGHDDGDGAEEGLERLGELCFVFVLFVLFVCWFEFWARPGGERSGASSCRFFFFRCGQKQTKTKERRLLLTRASDVARVHRDEHGAALLERHGDAVGRHEREGRGRQRGHEAPRCAVDVREAAARQRRLFFFVFFVVVGGCLSVGLKWQESKEVGRRV